MQKPCDLTGKVAIITGAGDGIGRASAVRLADAGAKVVCSDISLEKAQETVKLITDAGGEAIPVLCNVLEEKELEQLVDTTVATYGSVHILVNNAGGGGGGREALETLSMEYMQKIYTLNVLSGIYLTKLCAPHMTKSQYGSVINISSMAANMVSHNMIIYGGSKASLNQVTKYLAYDLGPYIRVNAIGPGAIRTRALESVLTPEIEEQMLKNTPIKRLGTVEDIANGVLFFASPASSWVSGQILYINGGGVQDLDA